MTSAAKNLQYNGEVWILRHGETDWAREGRHTGRHDLPLNATGLTQADALASTVAAVPFDRVLCSPLQRAQQTCKRAGLLDRAEITPDAMEWDYGAYEGRTTPEIRVDRPGWTIWNDGVLDGESLDSVATRALRILALVTPNLAAGERVAVFAHGHFLRVLAAVWLEQPPMFAARLLLAPARTGILGFEHETRVITRWNA
ncbi:MAG: histidine phosphatase family protein [Acidimicrobiia bacterium]